MSSEPSSQPFDEGPIPLRDASPIDVERDQEPAEVEWLEPEADQDGDSPTSPPIDDGFESILPDAIAQDQPSKKPIRPRARTRSEAQSDGETNGSGQLQSGHVAVARKPRDRRPALILIAVVVFVAATAGYRSWRVNLQNLPQQAESDLAAGRKALDSGDFANAKFKLRDAATALERLGSNEAAAIRQAAEEAAILADLCNVSLEEILQEAARARSPEEWAEQFDRLYKGQTILIEDELAAPGDGNSGRFSLHYQVLAGAKPALGRLDLNGLNLFAGKGFEVGTRVTFGARLASIRLLPDGRWQITFEPASGVLITDFKPLAYLGWNSPDPAPGEGVGR